MSFANSKPNSDNVLQTTPGQRLNQFWCFITDWGPVYMGSFVINTKDTSYQICLNVQFQCQHQ